VSADSLLRIARETINAVPTCLADGNGGQCIKTDR